MKSTGFSPGVLYHRKRPRCPAPTILKPSNFYEVANFSALEHYGARDTHRKPLVEATRAVLLVWLDASYFQLSAVLLTLLKLTVVKFPKDWDLERRGEDLSNDISYVPVMLTRMRNICPHWGTYTYRLSQIALSASWNG